MRKAKTVHADARAPFLQLPAVLRVGTDGGRREREGVHLEHKRDESHVGHTGPRRPRQCTAGWRVPERNKRGARDGLPREVPRSGVYSSSVLYRGRALPAPLPTHPLSSQTDAVRVVTAGADGLVRVFEVMTGRAVQSFQAARDPAPKSTQSEGHSLPACSLSIESICSSGAPPSEPSAQAHAAPVLLLQSDVQQLLTCAADGTLKRWLWSSAAALGESEGGGGERVTRHFVGSGDSLPSIAAKSETQAAARVAVASSWARVCLFPRLSHATPVPVAVGTGAR